MLKKLNLQPVHWFGLLVAVVLLIWVVRLCKPEPDPITTPQPTPPVFQSVPSTGERNDRAKLDSLNSLNP